MPFSPFDFQGMPSVSMVHIYSPTLALLRFLDKVLCDTGQLPSPRTARAYLSYYRMSREQLHVEHSLLM